MKSYTVTITHSERIYSGSAYADRDGCTYHRVVEAESSGAAVQAVLTELMARDCEARTISDISMITCIDDAQAALERAMRRADGVLE